MERILHNKQYSSKILQMTADTMFIIDLNGLCIDIAINADHWFLGKEESIIDKNMFDFLPEETSDAVKIEFDKVIKNKIVSTKNYKLKINQNIYYFKCIMRPFDDNLVLCQYRDITDRSKTKLEMIKLNNKLQEIEKVAKIGQFYFNDKTKNFTYKGFSGVLCNNKDYKSIHLDDYLKIIHEDDRMEFNIWINSHKRKINDTPFEYRILCEGKMHFIRVKAFGKNIIDNNWVTEGYCQNITELRKLDENLENLTKAVDYASEDIFAINEEQELIFANEQFRKHHQIENNADISTVSINNLLVNENIKTKWLNLSNEFTSLTDIIKYVTDKPFPKSENILAYDFFSYLVRGADGKKTIWTFGRDLSERIIHEARIKELNQIMTTVLENIPIAISVKDTGNEFRYLYRNGIYYDKNEKITHHIVGKTDFDLFPNDLAITYRNEDLRLLNDNEKISYATDSVDINGKKHIINKLKLLVENGDNPPLIIALRWDVTDMKKMELELIKAKDKAEVSDKLKSAFLANMSHEIRTPLNAIVGFSRVIADTEDAKERLGYYNIVEANNSRLLQLINEILDLSRIESGMMEFTETPINLNSMCLEIYDAHRFRCTNNVSLIFDESDTHLQITSDKNKLIQVFSNIIGNATKFTHEGNIRFGYRLKNDEVEFYVKDTGTGISPEKVGKIFERFTKLDNFAQGTGLGLSICKSIVEKLGGKISVKSKLGQGTTFTFTHPYVTQKEEQASDETELNTKDTNQTSFPSNEGQVILVAEDNESNFKLVNVMIGKAFKLVHAHDGVEAVTMFEQYQPELILMDIKMPNMNGLDAVRIIREISPDIPIIALSAYAYEEDRKAALDCGCNEFIAKPISQTILLQTLKKYL